MPNNDIGVQLSGAAVWTTGVSQKSKCCRRFAVTKSESKNVQSAESTALCIAAEVKYFKTCKRLTTSYFFSKEVIRLRSL